ncbi:MAG: M67 family metallopeptidase [Saprospiraceae bacterium]|nr:M67 family metallopeptidase [Saprospiraceae bacterium]MDW8483654.1 M67 family metallopeptidase [Saprospiraceae bacterium]
MLVFSPLVRERMLADARQTFPDECCGFLFGTEKEDGSRYLSDIVVVTNAKEGDKRRRFEIAPKDYLAAEQYAEERGLMLLGVYHSHPNHPAVPSEHDRLAAQPFFSYVIISVLDGRIGRVRSWRLNDARQFEEESIAEPLPIEDKATHAPFVAVDNPAHPSTC